MKFQSMFDVIDLIQYLFAQLWSFDFFLPVQFVQLVFYLTEFVHNELPSTVSSAHHLRGVIAEFLLI